MKKRKWLLSLLCLPIIFGIPGFGKEAAENTKVCVEMEDGSSFIIELYPKYAPKTVENFISLVNDGFYNGLTFHRIIPGFVVQGGDPLGTGTGGSGKKIKGEFSKNGVDNALLHEKGVLSMARTNDPNSATSQFFICLGTLPSLDGGYAAFGKVIEGMDVVENMASLETDRNDKPVKPPVMKTVSIIK